MRGLWMLLLAGCVGSEAAASEARSPIIGGGEPGAGTFQATGVITAGMKLRCTGTLIAPDVVLTAAHCLKPAAFGYLAFTLDDDLGDEVPFPAVRALVAHQHPDFDDSAELIDLASRNDIGVMILEHPLEAPFEQLALDPSPLPEDTLSLCGYGRDVWATASIGVKRTADVTVARTAELEFSTTDTGPQPCSGDSGAPLFDGSTGPPALVGIVSRAVGETVMCNTGAIITRTAPYAPWIAEAAQDRHVGCAGGLVLPLAPLAPLAATPRRRRRR